MQLRQRDKVRQIITGQKSIGTTGPNSKLEVNGTVNITGGLNVSAGGLNVIAGNNGIGTTGLGKLPAQVCINEKFHVYYQQSREKSPRLRRADLHI